jgi:hypothetical protein
MMYIGTMRKKVLMALAVFAAMPFWGQSDAWPGIDSVERAASEARSTLYVITDSADFLAHVKRQVMGNVALKIIVQIAAARQSDHLRALHNRGAELWVAEGPVSGTTLVVDKEYVAIGSKQQFIRDSWPANEKISEWEALKRSPSTIPCR